MNDWEHPKTWELLLAGTATAATALTKLKQQFSKKRSRKERGKTLEQEVAELERAVHAIIQIISRQIDSRKKLLIAEMGLSEKMTEAITGLSAEIVGLRKNEKVWIAVAQTVSQHTKLVLAHDGSIRALQSTKTRAKRKPAV